VSTAFAWRFKLWPTGCSPNSTNVLVLASSPALIPSTDHINPGGDHDCVSLAGLNALLGLGRAGYPGWQYPIVCQTDTGFVKFDNYNGHWGKQEELNKFLQVYTIEKARLEARKKGHLVSEAKLEDGSIKVTVHVGGAA